MKNYHFCVTRKGQPGEELFYFRVAVRGTHFPKQQVLEYIDRERQEGRLLGVFYVTRAKAGNAPFPPQFENGSDLFVYPVENATGSVN